MQIVAKDKARETAIKQRTMLLQHSVDFMSESDSADSNDNLFARSAEEDFDNPTPVSSSDSEDPDPSQY